MEPEIQRKLEETVIEILKNADMDVMTEFKVRNLASEMLGGIDLSLPDRKQFVRRVLESYLLSSIVEEEEPVPIATTAAATEEPETKEKAEEEQGVMVVEVKPKITSGGKEIDDHGDVVICRLSNKRRVTVQDFKGKRLVSIREYYEKDGKQLPSSKGISLSTEQWLTFRKSVPAIEEAIKKMESALLSS